MQKLTFRSYDRMTQEEFGRWLKTRPSGDLHHYELLDGFVVMEPPAGWPHGRIEVLVANRLENFLVHNPLGLVFGSSQGFDLPTGDTVEPDVAFVSNERFAAIPRPVQGFLPVVPDLVVEILSPSTKRIDQRQKKKIYECAGVREYWLIDPTARRVKQLLLTGETFDRGRVLSGTETLASKVLAGLRIRVGELFPEL
jgi:Uma2 family endonuclease